MNNPTPHHQLKIDQVTCWRGDKRLFHGLSHTLNGGELVQLEGHNGAGKTSLLRILTGLSQPEEGDVLWSGVSIFKNKDTYHRDMLYLGHKPGLKEVLTARENLLFYQSSLSKNLQLQDISQALELVGLKGFENEPVGRLSAGQQRRVALARLYLNRAIIWFLDEPFTAIDKQGVAKLMNHFEQHCEQGGIVLFTSHQTVESSKMTVRRISLHSKPDNTEKN